MSLLLRRYHAKAEPAGVEAPGGSASKKAWTEYALAEGKSAEELDGLTRDQIRDLFAVPETPAAGSDGQPGGEALTEGAGNPEGSTSSTEGSEGSSEASGTSTTE